MTSGRWRNSTRRAQLPPDWKARRLRVLDRDGWRCQHRDHPDGPICAAPATDVDHIQRGNNHNEANLQSLCTPHHRTKTAQEGVTARPTRKRPAQPHHGLKPDPDNPGG